MAQRPTPPLCSSSTHSSSTSRMMLPPAISAAQSPSATAPATNASIAATLWVARDSENLSLSSQRRLGSSFDILTRMWGQTWMSALVYYVGAGLICPEPVEGLRRFVFVLAEKRPPLLKWRSLKNGRLGQNPVILPPQIVEKPASITVFGILNCVFGGLAIVCTPCSLFGIVLSDKLSPATTMEMATGYKSILLVSSILGIGFAAWLLSLGIGLLKMKTWARRGSVIYSCIAIAWTIASVALNIIAMSMQWITVPKQACPDLSAECAEG